MRGAASVPAVTVVVVAHEAAAHVPACLDSIRDLDYPRERVEVIVVDNASSDGTSRIVRERYGWARLLRQERNLGFAEGNNVAAAASGAECLALVNADMRVDRGWLRELVALYEPDAGFPCVAGVILDWSGGRVDFAGGVVNFHAHGNHVGHGLPVERVRLEDGRELPFACGGAMLVGRDAFLAAGGFDPSYFIYFEDVDLGWRLRVLGQRTRLAARALAYHRGHGTTSAFPRAAVVRLYERNALRTVFKNAGDAARARLLPAATLLLSERARSSPHGPDPYLEALHDFTTGLPQLELRRAQIQHDRVLADDEVFGVFHRALQPAGRDDDEYLTAQEHVVAAFRVDELFPRTTPRVAVLGSASDPRADRLARVAESCGAGAVVRATAPEDVAGSDVVLATYELAASARDLAKLPALVVVDVAGVSPAPSAARDVGDAYLCASEVERDAWIAALAPPRSLPADASPTTSPLAEAVLVVPSDASDDGGARALRRLLGEPWRRERLEARRRAAEALVPRPAPAGGGTGGSVARRAAHGLRTGARRIADRATAARRAAAAPAFTCNICGATNPVTEATFEREAASCAGCGSTARWRAVVDVLALQLFGEHRLLPEFPVDRSIRGVGLSDWDGYAAPLAARFSYVNTYFDTEPRLDLTELDPALVGEFDFVICSEVLEHVAPPVDTAFRNLRRLLAPGGFAVVTVPYGFMEATVEHFPDLHRFEIREEEGIPVLRNVTRAGAVEVFRDLVFHGGEGATLEMRIFAERDLVRGLEEAGFDEVVVYRQGHAPFGAEWHEPWSRPIAARAPGRHGATRAGDR